MSRETLLPVLWAVVILGGAISGGLAAPPAPVPQETPITSIYNTSPDVTPAMTGYFTTGVALADINGDGADDLILANGNDMSPQPLVVYLNQSAAGNLNVIGPWPDWYSGEIAYFNGIAVGDVNGDGWLDVAVAVPFNTTRDISTGNVRVFLNREGTLEPQPFFVSAPCGCAPTSVALADVDGDADLDLVVAVPVEGKGSWPGTPGDLGRSLIYLNQEGSLEREPAWHSKKMMAADVVAADINQDGFLDLAFSAQQTSVFYGQRPGKGRVPLPTEPDWVSALSFDLSYGIDAGSPLKAIDDPPASILTAPSHSGLLVAVSALCTSQALNLPFAASLPREDCRSEFLAFRPELSTDPEWRSVHASLNASKLLLADLNADGYLDLLGDQWGAASVNNPCFGGPLWIFQGSPLGWRPIPEYRSQETAWRSGQDLAVANLHCPGAIGQRELTFEATAELAVLTLPERIVTVKGVTRGGRPAKYAWATGTNWVSLAPPLASGEKATVSYEVSPVLDIALGVWNPQFGSNLYLSVLRSSRCKSVQTNLP